MRIWHQHFWINNRIFRITGGKYVITITILHNVSNINTKGYTKQQAGTQAADALRTHTTYGAIGSGVVVTEISQILRQLL